MKNNYKYLKLLLLSLGFSVASPKIEAEGRELSQIGASILEWGENVSSKIEEHVVDPIGGKLSEVEMFSHSSLWLITNMPQENPSEKRHYFFVDKNSPKMKWTFYYDKDGKVVSSRDESIDSIEIREMYVSLTDLEETFKIETWLNQDTKTYTVNYADFSKEKLFDDSSNYKYGRFVNIEDIIPEDKIKEKYSMNDLKEILEIINDVSYEIKNDTGLSLKK